jgi:hypothetical protein
MADDIPDCTIVTEEGVEIEINHRKQTLDIKNEAGDKISLKWMDLIEVCAILLADINHRKTYGEPA